MLFILVHIFVSSRCLMALTTLRPRPIN